MATEAELVEEVVGAWLQWNRAPAHDVRAFALLDALQALAGDDWLVLRKAVTRELQDIGGIHIGADIRRAVRGWLDQHPQAWEAA
jgi:hypothetical protein